MAEEELVCLTWSSFNQFQIIWKPVVVPVLVHTVSVELAQCEKSLTFLQTQPSVISHTALWRLRVFLELDEKRCIVERRSRNFTSLLRLLLVGFGWGLFLVSTRVPSLQDFLFLCC